ncbi:MAG: hypothetical protein AB7O97_20515 [Planctomycetota bacterium]
MSPQRCPWCGAALVTVQVHGHGQCARCGTNVDPCCGGASRDAEADLPAPAPTQLDPDLLPALFARLGGVGATLTAECLELALARALDVPLGEAREILDAAESLGQLVRAGDTARLGKATRLRHP